MKINDGLLLDLMVFTDGEGHVCSLRTLTDSASDAAAIGEKLAGLSLMVAGEPATALHNHVLRDPAEPSTAAAKEQMLTAAAARLERVWPAFLNLVRAKRCRVMLQAKGVTVDITAASPDDLRHTHVSLGSSASHGVPAGRPRA